MSTCTVWISIPITVEYSYSPGRPAKWGGHPDTWEPADPPELELESTTFLGLAIPQSILDDQMAYIEQQILDAEEEAEADARADNTPDYDLMRLQDY